MIFFILYPVVAGETELILTCVVPIAELGQKCLEAASTLKYETLKQLHHCSQHHEDVSMLCFQTPVPVIKDEKIVKDQDGGLKVPLFDLYQCHV